MQLPSHYTTIQELIETRHIFINMLKAIKNDLDQLIQDHDEADLAQNHYGDENLAEVDHMISKLFSPQEFGPVEDHILKTDRLAFNFQEIGEVIDYDATKSETELMSATHSFAIASQFLQGLIDGFSPIVDNPHQQIVDLFVKDDATYQKELDHLFD